MSETTALPGADSIGTKNIHGDIVLNKETIFSMVSYYKTDPAIETAANAIKDRLITQGIELLRGGEVVEPSPRLKDIFKHKWKAFLAGAIDSIFIWGGVIVAFEKDEYNCVYPVAVPPESGEIIITMKEKSFQYEYNFYPSNTLHNSYLPNTGNTMTTSGGGPEKISKSRNKKNDRFIVFSGFGYDPRIIGSGAILTTPCAKLHDKKINLVLHEFFALLAQSKQSNPDLLLEYKEKEEGSIDINESIYENEEDKIFRKEQFKGVKDVEAIKRSKIVKYLTGPGRYTNPTSFMNMLKQKSKAEDHFVHLPVDRKLVSGPKPESKRDIIKDREDYEGVVYKTFGIPPTVTGAGVRVAQVNTSVESFNFRLKAMSEALETMITDIFKNIHEEDESEYIALEWLEKSEIAKKYVEEQVEKKMGKELKKLEKLKKQSKGGKGTLTREEFKLEKKINDKKKKVLQTLQKQFVQIAASKNPIQNLFSQQTNGKEGKSNGKKKDEEKMKEAEKEKGKEKEGKGKKRKRNGKEAEKEEKEEKKKKKPKINKEKEEEEKKSAVSKKAKKITDIMQYDMPPSSWWEFIDSRDLFQKMIRDQEELEKIYQSVKPDLRLKTMYLNTPEELKDMFALRVISHDTLSDLLLAKANIPEHLKSRKGNPFSEEEMKEISVKTFMGGSRTGRIK